MNQTNDLVMIKSFKSGIRLILDEAADMELILKEISDKFNKGSKFFGSEGMILSIDGRVVSEEEERLIINEIQNNCDLKIICILGKDEIYNRNFVMAMDEIAAKLKPENSAQFLYGGLSNNERIHLEGNIVVLGDINPGCVLHTTGSVVVEGRLFGIVIIDAPNPEEAFVTALEMAPERLVFNGYKYTPETKARWGLKPKHAPMIATFSENKIVLSPITKDAFRTEK